MGNKTLLESQGNDFYAIHKQFLRQSEMFYLHLSHKWINENIYLKIKSQLITFFGNRVDNILFDDQHDFTLSFFTTPK